jgi:hypothetical protein
VTVESDANWLKNLLNTVTESRVNNVGLNHQVLIYEFGWVGVVGVNTPDPARRDDGGIGLLGGKKGRDGCLIAEIQFTTRAQQKLDSRLVLITTHERGSRHACISCDEEFHPVLGKRGFDALSEAFHRQDLLIRTAGDTLVLAPPLIVSESQIGEMTEKLGKVIRAVA